MREIKFRAWDDSEKEMVSHHKVVLDPDYWFSGLLTGDVPEGDVLMQSTGLQDKNGNDIYSGDVCKAHHDFGPGGFSERTFTVHFDLLKGYGWEYWDLSQIEIIGNIHEEST